MDRITRQNPDGTYRLPAEGARSVRMEWQQERPVFFGVPIDLLGRYEDLGTPEELRALKTLYGTKK